METWLDAVDGSIQVASESAGSVPQALTNMAAITGGLFDALQGGFPILLEFWTQASRQPAIWQKAVAPYRGYLDYFVGIMQSGIDDGDFDESIDPEQAARTLTSVVMGLLLQATFDPEGAHWQDVTQFGINMIIDGMRRKQ